MGETMSCINFSRPKNKPTNMSDTIRTVIIEDEKHSVESLKILLKECDANIHIMGNAGSVHDGVKLINQTKPELVFMDIHLMDGSSFEIIDQTDYSSYEIIFITAYNQHATRAFDVAAVHYLLKPISKENLAEAVERFKEMKYDRNFEEQVKVLRSSLNNDQTKIILPLSDGLSIIKLEDIIRCESSNNYTTFFLKNKKQLVVSRPINFYETLLVEMNFVRIHSKHLINLQYVEKYVKGRGGYVVMEGGSEVDVSVGKKRDFLDKLNVFATGYI